MNWKTGLRKGRSHLVFAVALIVAGAVLIRLDDEDLKRHTDRHCSPVDATQPCSDSERQRP